MMKSQRSQKDSHTQALRPQDILAEWLASVSLLHLNYRQINGYVNQYEEQRLAQKNLTKQVGQCPVGDLVRLLIRIEEELEKLLVEMDHLEELESLNNYKKLIEHTVTLDQLNQSANGLLHLAALPPS